jgi:predicted  nucleic acid-binding Zn ribbon protein
MYVAEISFVFGPEHDEDAAVEAVHGLCHSLRMNGQILGREWPIARVAETYRLTVMLPARDSLSATHGRKWVRQARKTLREAGQRRQRVRILGASPDALDPCVCEGRKSFILYTDYLSLESCLRCGDCFHPVPLYTVPPTTDDGFYDVMCW